MRRVLVALALQLLMTGAAQSLVVNGTPVAEFTNTLVPGTSYAAAEPLARAMGASHRYDGAAVTFELAGRFAALAVGDGVGEARLQGRTAYVPVKDVARRLGGEVDYLGSTKTVVVVFPRAQLLSVQPPDVWGSYERFILRLNAPVAIEERFEPSLNTVRFRFARTDLGRKQNFSGERFSDALLSPGEGYTDFTLTLGRGSTYDMYTVPKGAGTEVVIDIFSAEEADAQEAPESPLVVLDAGPADASKGAAEGLRAALAARGFDAQLTATGGALPPPDVRASAGIGATLFLSLRAAPLEARQVHLYYLDGSGPSTQAVIRQNAQEVVGEPAETSPRRILQRLAPDLPQGEAYAEALAEGLTAAGWQLLGVEGAPLYLLSGAAGRGVLLELSPAGLSSEVLAETLADTLAPLLQQGVRQ